MLICQVHANEDDLGLGGETDSLTTGHAGTKIGCCVIEETTGRLYSACVQGNPAFMLFVPRGNLL